MTEQVKRVLKMDRSLLLAICIAFLVFSCVKGTPIARAPADVNYIQCRALSLTLNEIARDLYNKVRIFIKIYIHALQLFDLVDG